MNMSGSPSFNLHLSNLYISDWEYPSCLDESHEPFDDWMGDRLDQRLADLPPNDGSAVNVQEMPPQITPLEYTVQDSIPSEKRHQLFLAEFSDPETAELAGELFIDALSLQDAWNIAQDHACQWGFAIFSLVAATDKQIRLHRLRMA